MLLGTATSTLGVKTFCIVCYYACLYLVELNDFIYAARPAGPNFVLLVTGYKFHSVLKESDTSRTLNSNRLPQGSL